MQGYRGKMNFFDGLLQKKPCKEIFFLRKVSLKDCYGEIVFLIIGIKTSLRIVIA